MSNLKCEVCNKEIPDDFVNALCIECYEKQSKENEQRKEVEREERKLSGRPIVEEIRQQDGTPHLPIMGITNPDYAANPQQDEINMLARNYTQYTKSGKWLWKSTRSIYTFIKDSFRDIVVNHPQYPKFVWKPLVCDIGCGTGLGSNILSQEADFVWGIDKNPESIAFANEMFARQKNNIYYTPEIRYDVVDVNNPQPNIDMKFDVAVAVEIFEHLENPEKLLEFIKHILRPGGIAWISTPNRNNKHIGQDHPTNKYHTMELTSQEFVAVLKKYFDGVKLFNSIGEPCEEDTTHTPILACIKNQSSQL